MPELLDDSLILGWDPRRKRPLTARDMALSVSTAKLFDEDPLLFYHKKVLFLKEPPSTPLAFGNAMHAGLEHYYGATGDRIEASIAHLRSEIRRNFAGMDTIVDRVNPDEPDNPKGKVDLEVDLAYLEEKGERLLRPVLEMFESRWEAYTPVYLQGGQVRQLERTLGEVARERGMAYAELMVFNRKRTRKEPTPCAVVAGVPFHGYIDVILEWPDGTPMIVDHKFVSQIVPYYPHWQGGRTRYEPAYDPGSDFQLDLYATATGIMRAGFQFVSKSPQYLPPHGPLYPSWVDERDWKRLRSARGYLPMAWAASPEGTLHYVLVWRPEPQDHPRGGLQSMRPLVAARAAGYVRRVAEAMTEAFLLYMSGVDPEIAFPPGHPDEIGRKSCPFCHFATACPLPQSSASKEEHAAKAEAHLRLLTKRELLCQQTPEIMERRALWRSLAA